ncbi:biotin--[acetyl-CoA-carboxylase] ligase [Reichenbachiella sp. ABR2-5]|uniref:Biotin--[acetyl-CoA-carboxylase] ligase n=1 Tax=Reichenbachiella ulvae TaxID=2980104 RepID=A0ABT3CVH9_9BACT|nr:biotin--[acetyl-CoA-carboxylase] ligase [Reichenbachiella ulvae]
MHKFFAKTQFLGKKVIFLPQCHSTNEVAMSLVNHGHAREGMVVITEDQTAGKGQRGNSWHSEPGKNLTFSFIIKPHFVSLDRQFQLHTIVSLGILDAIRKFTNEQLKVKWPNDIYLGEKKLGGILIENTIRGSQIDYSVVGIGLNANQVSFELPNATSLIIHNKVEVNLDELAEEVLIQIEKRYSQVQEGINLMSEYEASLFGKERERNFQDGKGKFRGIIKGVNENGQLMVWDQQCLRTYNFKEVSFLD